MSDNNSDVQLELFQEAFDGMFEDAALESTSVQSEIADPGPPVPIDTNVFLLLSLGIGIAYWTTRRGGYRYALKSRE